MQADLIVIGGGMAGTVAALRAAGEGADVVLIRKGYGASAMSSGALDIAGPERFLPHDSWDTLPTITDCLQEILRSRPAHPYSIIAGGRDGLERLSVHLRNARDFLCIEVPALGFRDAGGRNLGLLSMFGTVKFSAYALPSLAAGNMLEMRDAHILLVGLRGFVLFRPHLCAQALSRFSSLHQPNVTDRIDVLDIDLPGAGDAPSFTPFEIARRLDDPQVAEEVAGAVAARIHADITHVGFPPVLGLENHPNIFAIFCRALEPKVFELISPGYSVPGYRLQNALAAALFDSGVRVVNADVVSAETDGRLVRNLLLENSLSHRTATAKRYILAAGKFSSGGLVVGDFPKEPIFGLPLFADCQRADGAFVQNLLDWNVAADQRFLSCGIHVDSSLRPLDAFGNPAYDNLFAAGSIIGEYDYVADKCGLGVALLTGYVAAEEATK